MGVSKNVIFCENGVVKSEQDDRILLYNYKLTLLKKTFIIVNKVDCVFFGKL